MSVRVSFNFDAKSVKAAKLAERQGATMVKNITDETMTAIRNAIGRSLREGIPPYDAAKVIKSIIGLNDAQAQAAMTYRSQLIDNGLSMDRVDSEFNRYTDTLLASRARTVARTEIMDALNAGQNEAFVEAQDEGLLSKDAEKEWITADPCDECEEYDGATVPISEEFEDGDPPLHPNCRCTIGIAAG